jgi:hypothetical protein
MNPDAARLAGRRSRAYGRHPSISVEPPRKGFLIVSQAFPHDLSRHPARGALKYGNPRVCGGFRCTRLLWAILGSNQ